MTATDLAALDAASDMLPLATASDPDVCGGKAANLSRAMQAGLPVPDGVVLSPVLVSRIAAGQGTAQCERLAALLGTCHPLGTRFAVRSSAVDEDGVSASFAGQYVTRLGVRPTPGALGAAIVAVHGSLNAPAAVGYRARIGIRDGSVPGTGHGSSGMAVLVQSLIEADAAGVMFTRNPMTGDDERVVEAAIGLGESVVAGLVTPDLYRIAPDGAVLERRVGCKRVAVRSAARGGTEELPVDTNHARAPCLDDAALVGLHLLAARCGEVFGPEALNIEWAFVGAELHLLQCRAVTSPMLTGAGR